MQQRAQVEELVHRRGAHLQFRSDFFNLLNHPAFGPPPGDYGTTATFGVSGNALNNALGGGGSQGVKDTGNFPAFMRYGFRSSLKADYCVHNLSFRCAKDL